MKVRELLRGIPDKYRRDAEIILSHLLGISPTELPLYYDKEFFNKEEFVKLLKKRAEGIPTAYVIGEWECMGRVFKVEEGVLIPRPETEILIEETLELIPKDKEMQGLELGSGTGCISINLLLDRPKLRMIAVDIEPKAVELTLRNAKLHGVEDRIEVLEGDLFQPVSGRKFDFIVSNPPYIPESFWERLPEEVKREGRKSLIGGKKGYEFYEVIAQFSPKFLKERGFVALEIGHDQGEIVKKFFESRGFWVKVIKDYSGYDRVVIAKKWS